MLHGQKNIKLVHLVSLIIKKAYVYVEAGVRNNCAFSHNL
jgi:hypothetical protein